MGKGGRKIFPLQPYVQLKQNWWKALDNREICLNLLIQIFKIASIAAMLKNSSHVEFFKQHNQVDIFDIVTALCLSPSFSWEETLEEFQNDYHGGHLNISESSCCPDASLQVWFQLDKCFRKVLE